ncbi:hypothetical protein MBLNU230_g5467t1 [Neophaeotheca triangularis]
MDAAAILKSQGWRGTGHSLDTSDKGLKKPLLVSKKVDVLGLGINKHNAVSGQWWLRAFDQGLQNLGKGGQSTLRDVREKGVFAGGLYGRFVKGEGVPGTLQIEGQKKDGAGKTPARMEAIEDFSASSSDSSSSDSDSENSELEAQSTPNTSAEVSSSEDKTTKSKHLDAANGTDSHAHVNAARMHLMKHPREAPSGASKQTDRKRKREDQPKDNRARRRLEQSTEEQTIKAEKEREKEEKRAVKKAKLAHKEAKHEAKDGKTSKKSAAKKKQKAGIDEKLAPTPKIQKSSISSEKFKGYAKRAAEKGISVDQYIKRREEKYAEKHAS